MNVKNRFPLWVMAFTITAASITTCSIATAQGPDTSTRYHIVPHFSTINRSGGFAGFNDDYLITGGFDFLQLGGPPTTVEFDNVEMWGSLITDQPSITIVYPFHDWLGIDNLSGTQLPVGAPFDVYQFSGQIPDGSTINLTASVMGPWMYLRGQTQAPQNTSDFFAYDLRVLARTDPFADPNRDGSVDAADFTMLQDQGGSIAGVGLSEWHAQFGETAPDMDTMDASMNAALATLVPEPGSMPLAILGILFAGLASRRPRGPVRIS